MIAVCSTFHASHLQHHLPMLSPSSEETVRIDSDILSLYERTGLSMDSLMTLFIVMVASFCGSLQECSVW